MVAQSFPHFSAPARLRALLAGGKLVAAPGVADAVNAKLVAREGFQAVYMTGGGTSAARLGTPDVGLLTMTEMVDNAQRIAEASQIAVIADADTGYGGVANVQRTIRAYERAGVAAVHLEDQAWPKRCGHFSGKRLEPAEEMVAKIKAAVDARKDEDFVIIARTDAYSVEGYDRALDRASLYEEAGADVIFVEELRTADELAGVPKRFRVPTLYNMGSSGKTPFLSMAEIEALGFRIVIYPNFVMRAALFAAQRLLRELRETGSVTGMLDQLMNASERLELLGSEEFSALERRYHPDAVAIGYAEDGKN